MCSLKLDHPWQVAPAECTSFVDGMFCFQDVVRLLVSVEACSTIVPNAVFSNCCGVGYFFASASGESFERGAGLG